MGVKDVWHIAGPCEERISLHSLRGQTLAIDLAGWVVQNNMQPGMQFTVTRPHLRNLFFRISTLLSLDILPVVVLDGIVPDLKKATVAARNQAQWGGGGGQVASPKRQQRRQFTGVLRDCQRLLTSLGVPCVTAPGEAEAFCSALNRAGLCDAVVSDDSDCFCYGAKTVLRNFSTDPKSFSVSQYMSSRLQAEVGLSRQRMVVMALLLGCDYNLGGVAGVGREAVTKLFSVWGKPSSGELERVLAWAEGSLGTEAGGLVTSKPVHCGVCGHEGSVASHRRGGCGRCGTHANCRGDGASECDCTYHSLDNQKLLAEWNIIQKAVASPGWPFRNVVEEFYRDLTKSLPSSLRWTQPSPGMFVDFCVKKMDWVREYCVEKLIDTVVGWQVKNPAMALVMPSEVIKKRIRSGENMFEVQWTSHDNTLPQTFVACVSATTFSEIYPEVFKDYTDKLEAKEAAKKKPRKKKDKENVPPKEKTKATKSKKKEETNQLKLDNYIKKDEPKDKISEGLEMEKVKLKPKNLVLTKMISEDAKYNNKVISKKLVTPDTSDNVSMESLNVHDHNKTDSYVYNPQKKSPGQVDMKMNISDSMMMSESMKEYLEEDNDSDLSDIIDEIVGNKKSRDGASGLNADIKKSFSTSTPSYNIAPNIFAAQPLATGSPMLRKVHQNNMREKVKNKPKASDVFDMGDVSLVLEECSVQSREREEDTNGINCDKNKQSEENMSISGVEDSFDEFDCMESHKPLAQRLGKL